MKASYGVYPCSNFLYKGYTHKVSQLIHINELQRHPLKFESSWEQKGKLILMIESHESIKIISRHAKAVQKIIGLNSINNSKTNIDASKFHHKAW